MGSLAVSASGLVGLAVLWELGARLGILPPELSRPSDIVAAGARELGDAALWRGIGRTLWVWFLSMLIALLAIPVGVALGLSRTLFQATWFVIEFCRTIPPVVILPLAVLQFGVTVKMELLVVVFTGAWTILYNTMYGTRDVDPVQHDTSAVYGISWWRRITHVILPTASPFIATGIRIAGAGALLLTVLCELIGGAPGIGQEISTAAQSAAYPQMYAFIIFAGLLGLALNQIMLVGERRLLRWHPSYRETSS